MGRLGLAIMIGTSLLLASCTPLIPGIPRSPTPVDATTSIGTVEPEQFTPLPPGFTPPPVPTPTSLPTLPGGLGLAELKYRLLAEFPDFFFCDPDFYPVAQEDEMELARQHFPEIQADLDEFGTILAHNDLAGVSTFTDEQKLLIYREHKKLSAIQLEPAGASYRFQIQVAETEGEGELVTGLVDGQGTITVLERTASFATCPICLAGGTRIDTHAGLLRVESLRPGMRVWTLSAAGERIARPLVRIGKTVVPRDHQVIHLVLEDGREVWVSPGHPTVEGITVGQLQVGDPLDGSIVLSADRVIYTGLATYDLLPAGETGFYWANGILLASTLKP
jgi:Hint domain